MFSQRRQKDTMFGGKYYTILRIIKSDNKLNKLNYQRKKAVKLNWIFINIFVKMSSSEIGQLIDIGDETTTTESSDLKEVREELNETKKRLDEALSEVAVAQILQENLSSVERQKVRY